MQSLIGSFHGHQRRSQSMTARRNDKERARSAEDTPSDDDQA